ncbi:hypothetical protein Tco_1433287 [Tanacetum coccineum]
MSITSSNKPRLFEAEHSTMPNHDTDKVPSDEMERNMTDPSISIFDSSMTDYDSAGESSICSTPLHLLEKLAATTGKLKNVKIEDDPPLAIVMKELNELKLQMSKNKSSYSRNKNSQQVPPNALQNKYKTQFKMNCELCGKNNHLSENGYEVLYVSIKLANVNLHQDPDILGSIPINKGLSQAIPTSLSPQPIGEATKAFNLRRIPPGV